MIWLWPGSGNHVLQPKGLVAQASYPAGKTRGTRGRGRMVQWRPREGDKVLQTSTKAGGGVRDHGGGVGTALLRYLQLNVGKTKTGTFLA